MRLHAHDHVGDQGRLGEHAVAGLADDAALWLSAELLGSGIEQHDSTLLVHDDDGVVESRQHVTPRGRGSGR
jgi:hypothetical protein